ncbi:MAG: HDOD domain-containing protein [Terracidiphilus sp.]|jgi:EAL and modified HD-GYP domain-containing signal transduction protein
MTSQVITAARPDAASHAESTETGTLRYVARQPILDRRGRVHGYELLFRAGPDVAFYGDGNLATRTMLDNTVIFGLEKLTAGLPAFVNCTKEALTGELVKVLPPSMTVLEILETLEPTPELIAACRKLKSEGFRLALDDFVWSPEMEPLIDLADYIKVDFMLTRQAARAEMRERLNGVSVAMLAEKVETQEEYQEACAEGFTLFQGYYFCRPILLKNRKIPANRLSHIELLQMLQNETIDVQKLAELLKRDASLTYRLLRLVNSPVSAIRQEVRSIEAALVIVGEETFRRIAMLAITSELTADQPQEILLMAFARACFCEAAAGLCALERNEQYLLGMFSMLPAMLRVPMTDLVPSLALRAKIREALLGAISLESSLLRWTECHERGEWDRCDAIAQSYGLNREDLMRRYVDAVAWSETAVRFVG